MAILNCRLKGSVLLQIDSQKPTLKRKLTVFPAKGCAINCTEVVFDLLLHDVFNVIQSFSLEAYTRMVKNGKGMRGGKKEKEGKRKKKKRKKKKEKEKAKKKQKKKKEEKRKEGGEEMKKRGRNCV